jgi:hypothetical protein
MPTYPFHDHSYALPWPPSVGDNDDCMTLLCELVFDNAPRARTLLNKRSLPRGSALLFLSLTHQGVQEFVAQLSKHKSILSITYYTILIILYLLYYSIFGTTTNYFKLLYLGSLGTGQLFMVSQISFLILPRLRLWCCY